MRVISPLVGLYLGMTKICAEGSFRNEFKVPRTLFERFKQDVIKHARGEMKWEEK